MNSLSIPWTLGVLGSLFILSCYLTYCFWRNPLWHRHLIDFPNERSAHQTPTPRGAGIVFVFLWIAFLLLGMPLGFWDFRPVLILAPGSILVAITGLLDDKHSLPADWRLVLYVIAAVWGAFILGGLPTLQLKGYTLTLGWIGIPLMIFIITWSTNLFNFMDGADGLSSVETFFVYGVGGAFFWLSNAPIPAILCWSIVAVVGGFFIWNRPRAKVFMGDTGSIFLGFLIPIFAFWGEKKYGISCFLWFMLYLVFFCDATLTLIRRMLRKERWYEAHRLHAFQRLIHAKILTNTQLLLGVCLLNTLLAFLALGAFFHPSWMLASLGLSVVLALGSYLVIEQRAPMFPQSHAAPS